MKIVAITSPGRFPTVVADPGRWWSAVAASGRHQMSWYQASTAWWREVCSAAIRPVLLAPLSFTQRLRRRVEWKAAQVDLESTGQAAQQALAALCTPGPYLSAVCYVQTVTPIAKHLATLNAAQGELYFSLGSGVRVLGLDYNDSTAIASYAEQPGCLSESIRAAVAGCVRDIDLLVVSVTSAENLLCAMIAVRHLRQANPRVHVCLADHGYENFSLGPHLARLREVGTLARVFDTVIEAQNDRDDLLPALVAALVAGKAPKGHLTRADLEAAPAPEGAAYMPPPPPPTFTSEPVFWTRVSRRRCYWGKCAFCVQNNKHDDLRVPSIQEVPGALERIEALIAAGYRTFIFSDEALPPPLIRRFCDGILQRDLSFRWACRARLEPTYDRELFALMRQAGCYEVLYGLESISPRMQERMCKSAAGLPADRVAAIFHSMSEVGLGMHVNLLAAFPGDTPRELRETVDFLVENLRGVHRATFTLNRFALFLDTPVTKAPDQFGVTLCPACGDMPGGLDYELTPELRADTAAIDALLPECQERLLAGLGWRNLGRGAGAEAAVSLYLDSGHGALFKQQADDPFAPILESTTTGDAV